MMRLYLWSWSKGKDLGDLDSPDTFSVFSQSMSWLWIFEYSVFETISLSHQEKRCRINRYQDNLPSGYYRFNLKIFWLCFLGINQHFFDLTPLQPPSVVVVGQHNKKCKKRKETKSPWDLDVSLFVAHKYKISFPLHAIQFWIII